MRRINVVLDVDECLASHVPNYQKGFENDVVLKTFAENGLIIDAGLKFAIHPGVIEFIQWLDANPRIKISFFSAAIGRRVREFIIKLLILALGKERYKKMKDSVRICSKEDLIYIRKDRGEVKVEQTKVLLKYNNPFGEYEKNLKCVLEKDEDIAWAVIIDDDKSYFSYEQLPNLLKIPMCMTNQFYLMTTENELGLKQPSEIFSRINHIYYAAGLLDAAIEKADNKSINLVDALFSIQFVKKSDNFYESCYSELSKKFVYFERGLTLLQKINPDLQFSSADCLVSKPNIIEKTQQISVLFNHRPKKKRKLNKNELDDKRPLLSKPQSKKL